jgi:hypothetical protein
MKYLAKIQSEFLKEASNWDDLSLEEQKSYLQRHPKSKRKITAKPNNNEIKTEKSLTHIDEFKDALTVKLNRSLDVSLKIYSTPNTILSDGPIDVNRPIRLEQKNSIKQRLNSLFYEKEIDHEIDRDESLLKQYRDQYESNTTGDQASWSLVKINDDPNLKTGIKAKVNVSSLKELNDVIDWLDKNKADLKEKYKKKFKEMVNEKFKND